tara:strand:+ start:8674 stop:8991 length:318 start_codon:yes stop_codon:yes gene_type:complete
MSFRSTGLPESANVVNATAGASSNLVAAPGTGKHIVIYDVIVQSGATQVVKDATGGTIMIYAPEGHTGLRAPISLGENKALWACKSGDNGNTFAVTITYSIESIH